MKNPEILEGFIPYSDHGIKPSWWTHFAWFGELQILFKGKIIVVSACGTARGDHGDMIFKLPSDFTQAECDEMEVIAFKTKNKSDQHP